MTVIYGIPNCDTVRKARKWLTENEIDYIFHDFRKDGLESKKLSQWSSKVGWETLLNRRGQSWRKISDAEKKDIHEAKALKLMLQEPTLIKRPVLVTGKTVKVGFTPAEYQALFN